MSNITIGQYFPGNSFLHKLDPRMKIVLLLFLMVSIFVCKNFVSLGLVTLLTLALVIISKIKLKTILKGMKPILVIVIITTLLNLFYGSGEPIVKLGIFKITENGIFNAVFMALRITLLFTQGMLLTYTTTPTALTDALESLMKPLRLMKVDTHSIAMTMTIALRFIPTLIEEVDKIMSAQKSRGADMESGGLIKRAKAVIPIIIPLFISSFRRANELADAMECRCYRGGDGRTKMKVMSLTAKDYFALIAVIIYFTAIILIRIFMANII
jgi:energy-coupling factor transport system permease protein